MKPRHPLRGLKVVNLEPYWYPPKLVPTDDPVALDWGFSYEKTPQGVLRTVYHTQEELEEAQAEWNQSFSAGFTETSVWPCKLNRDGLYLLRTPKNSPDDRPVWFEVDGRVFVGNEKAYKDLLNSLRKAYGEPPHPYPSQAEIAALRTLRKSLGVKQCRSKIYSPALSRLFRYEEHICHNDLRRGVERRDGKLIYLYSSSGT